VGFNPRGWLPVSPACRIATQEDRKKLTETIEHLRVIDGMTALDYGVAVPSDRPVVDDSFGIAMRMRFTDVQALHRYETAPPIQRCPNYNLNPMRHFRRSSERCVRSTLCRKFGMEI
jgi:hypothetical protein